jgi:hypothetical protein
MGLAQEVEEACPVAEEGVSEPRWLRRCQISSSYMFANTPAFGVVNRG